MSRVLVVEDEAHLADGLRFNLEAEGYSVDVVGEGETAVQRLSGADAGFDAVVLDVMLPGMNGFEVVSALRKARNYVPVLILTARGRPEDVLEGFGGHKMAAGLSIRSDAVATLADRFEAAVRESTRPEDFVAKVDVDLEIGLDDVRDSLLEDLDRLEPFGPGNAEPTFFVRGASVVSRRVVGEAHLKLYLRHGTRALSAIAFRMGEAPIAEGDQVDVLAVPERDDFSGGLRMRVKQLRKTPAA